MKSEGNIKIKKFVREDLKALIATTGANPMSEDRISSAANYLGSRCSQNEINKGLPGRHYLINGVVIKVTRRGHSHYKGIEFNSESEENIKNLVNELNLS